MLLRPFALISIVPEKTMGFEKAGYSIAQSLYERISSAQQLELRLVEP